MVKARRAIASAATLRETEPRPRQSGPIRDWLGAFLDGRSLTHPDGRALHRYRMADGEYDQAKKQLRHLAREGRLVRPDYRSGALFVAYCAEWFRRKSIRPSFGGTIRRPTFFHPCPTPANSS